MKFKIIPILLFFVYSLSSNAQSHNDNKDARSIIELSIKEMGGRDLLSSVRTLYLELTTNIQGMDVTVINREMAPNKSSIEIRNQGGTLFRAWFNGNEEYQWIEGKVVKSDTLTMKYSQNKKHIYTDLDFLDSALYSLERLQDEIVNGMDCYKVSAKNVNGILHYHYIDKKSGLLVKIETKEPESSELSIKYYSDFKKFGDLLFYGKLALIETDGSNQEMVVKKVLINQQVDESDFES